MVTFLIFAVTGYAVVCVLIFLMQDGMLFFPRPSDPQAVKQLERWQRSIENSEVTLFGWLIPARDPGNAPLVFYFGGNGEDVSITAIELGNETDANVILMNYRGYGASEGTPSEKALFSDALIVYDTLIDTMHNGKVVAFGRSLGSGVSVYLASQRKIDAVVLTTPYDSIRAVAHGYFPWLPVSFLIRHPFDSLGLAPTLDIPALFIVAEHDNIIPTVHAQNLADHWGGRSQWVLIKGATHNSIGGEDYWGSIRNFLKSL